MDGGRTGGAQQEDIEQLLQIRVPHIGTSFWWIVFEL